MMAKLKAKKEAAAAKMGEMKEAHDEKNKAKWRDEVMEGGVFRSYEAWVDVYEPKKEKKDKGDDDSGPNAVEKAAARKVRANMTRDVLKQLMDVVARLLGPASEALAANNEKELGDTINAASGAVLSYRFAHKGEKKMAYFRSIAAERLALALGAALAKESAAQGNDGAAKLDPEQLKKVVDAAVAKVTAEVEVRQAHAVESLKSSPLFNASGVDGAQVDAGVVALTDFLRGYVESKIGVIVKVLDTTLAALLTLAAKHQEAIAKHAAAAAGAEPDAAFASASAEMLAEIEGAYSKLHDNVNNYAGDLVTMIMGTNGGDEPAAAE